jgi:hypothetical protein
VQEARQTLPMTRDHSADIIERIAIAYNEKALNALGNIVSLLKSKESNYNNAHFRSG